MSDVVLIATIVAFFLAAALLVRALDRVIAGSGDDADPLDADLAEEAEASAGRPA
jgi:hypothetical protein